MVGPGEPLFVAVITHTHVALNKTLPVTPQGIDSAPLSFKSDFAIAYHSSLIDMASLKQTLLTRLVTRIQRMTQLPEAASCIDL